MEGSEWKGGREEREGGGGREGDHYSHGTMDARRPAVCMVASQYCVLYNKNAIIM